MKTITSSLVVVFLCLAATSNGQPMYNIKWQQESTIFITSWSMHRIGGELKEETIGLTYTDVARFEKGMVMPIDRIATSSRSVRALRNSDVLLYGSFSAPALLLVDKRARQESWRLGIMWAEALAINSGATFLLKYAIKRPRPYVFNPDVDDAVKTVPHARSSFVSGHTSTVAMNTFFAARVFSDYHPDSPLKPYIWTVAAVIPALTGYYRVRGGAHYPTDVVGGYILGAAVGYLIPKLHKAKADPQYFDYLE